MKKKLLVCVMAVVLACSVTACGDKGGNSSNKEEQKDVTAERGTVEGNAYTNKSIGMQATFPEECTMLSDEEIETMMESPVEGEGMIYDAIANIGAGEGNIQVAIEDTKETMGKTYSEEDYVKNLEDNLESSYKAEGLTVDKVTTGEASHGNIDFKTVTAEVSGMTQVYYIHQVGKYMAMIVTTSTEASEEPIQKFMDSVKAM